MGTQRPRQFPRGRARIGHPDSSSVLILPGPTASLANGLSDLGDLKPNQLCSPILPKRKLGPEKKNASPQWAGINENALPPGGILPEMWPQPPSQQPRRALPKWLRGDEVNKPQTAPAGTPVSRQPGPHALHDLVGTQLCSTPTPPTPDCAPSSQARPTLLRHCAGHTGRARTSPHTHLPSEDTAHSWGLAGTRLKGKTASYSTASKMSLFKNSRELQLETRKL